MAADIEERTGSRASAARGDSVSRTGRAVAVLLVGIATGLAFGLIGLRRALAPRETPPYTLSPPEDGGPAPVTLSVQKGDRFALVLRPSGTVYGTVGVRAYLVRGRQARRWEPPVVVERNGTVRIGGDVESNFAGVDPGPWDIALAIGSPQLLPKTAGDVLDRRDASAATTAKLNEGAAWQLVVQPIVLGP